MWEETRAGDSKKCHDSGRVLFYNSLQSVCVPNNKSGWGHCSLHWPSTVHLLLMVWFVQCAHPEKSAFIFNYIKQGT